MRKFFMLILWVLLDSMTVHAQFSFTPKPLPEASVFPVTEIGYAYRVTPFAEDNSNRLGPYRHHYLSEIGLMKNLSPNYAAGGIFHVGTDAFSKWRAGFKARLRRWFYKFSVDLSAGMLFWDSRSLDDNVITGGVAISLKNSIGFIVQVESAHLTAYLPPTYIPADKNDKAVYFGMKIGSKPGAWINGAAATTFGTLLLLLAAGVISPESP